MGARPHGKTGGVGAQHWTARPGPEEVSRIRREVTEYAMQQGLRREVVDNLRLAVSEVVANAVMHAYPDGGAEGAIKVVAECGDGELTIRVVDDGIGLRPRVDSPGAGLGLAIAGTVAERLSVKCPPHGGTEVRMTFAATA